MKIRLYLIMLIATLLLSACQKEPLNSDVEGHWQLEQFTLKATQEVVTCDRIYYGINRFVTEVSYKKDGNKICFIARTAYRENQTQLVLTDFKVAGSNTSDTKVDATEKQMEKFGINNPKETIFQIVKCAHKQLILESDYARLQLKKF